MGKSRWFKNKFHIFLILGLLAGCSGLEDSERERIRKQNASGQAVYRSHDEKYYSLASPKHVERESYPWEDTLIGDQVRITKEFFRCKGSSLNPHLSKNEKGETTYCLDCSGTTQHSLPLKDGREFVYPALIDLLNFIQEKSRKKVIITCGHRCPTHNTYADPSKMNQTSKHMIGAEVDFYVKGWEWSPEKVVALIQSYYAENTFYRSDPRFTEFKRYEKTTNVTTLPWYNKEIFVKIFKKDEGRDLDNTHRYPYVSIQLKWDRETESPVSYSWSKAFNGYLRY